MTPTNNQIYMAAITLLNNAALGYPISWPGFNFTPPSSGVWLEVSFFPNEGIDNGLAYSDTVVPRGIFQVACVDRPGRGTASIHAAADQIRALYAKGTGLIGSVRVIREPYDMELETEGDRLMVVVSVEYSG
jgi:hypothetical protein